MGNLSRTQKNSALYDKLHNDTEAEVSSERLSAYAERLHELDSDNFAKMPVEPASTTAFHARREQYYRAQPKPEAPNPIDNKGQTPGFNNEYLDEFISEVKQYNIKKGLRTVEDTQANVFNEIHKNQGSFYKASPLSSPEIADLKTEPAAEESTETIAEQMQELVGESDPAPAEPAISAGQKPESKADDHFFGNTAMSDQKNAPEDEAWKEETLKLKKQLDEHDDELTKVNDQVNNTGRLLNLVLVVLFLMLLVALGCLAYFLLIDRGII